MAAPRLQRYYTPEEYLALEREADYKSEYIAGQIVAMAGASREHVTIVTNLSRILSSQLLERPCDTYTTDMRVAINTQELYTYPDLVVVCGEAQFEDANVDILVNPTLIVEVLSPSTERYYRGVKFGYYRQIPSLQEYVLVTQDKVLVEQFVREGDHWVFNATTNLDAILRLPAIDCDVPIAEVYRKVAFSAEDPARESPGN
jgi:Uma2 family endonuclease